jgi:hypothetical protein
MKDDVTLLQVARQLVDEVQLLQMDLTVQRSAYVLLVRRLAQRRQALPDELASDLERMGRTQEAQGWQVPHSTLAGHLRLLRPLGPPRRRARPLQRSSAASSRAPCRRTLCG